jgi:hypothetical protein
LSIRRGKFQVGYRLVGRMGRVDGEFNDSFQLLVRPGISEHLPFREWLSGFNLKFGYRHGSPPGGRIF